MIASLDTETTGIDLFHGVKPFIVTTCQPNRKQLFWQWYVNPKTREPIIPSEDLDGVRDFLSGCDEIVLHNAKFDCHVLDNILPDWKWDWSKIHDTLVAAHVLASNEDKDLTSLCKKYLDYDIEPLEKDTKKAVKESYSYITKHINRKRLADKDKSHWWAVAKKGHSDMPSAKQKTWKFDLWIPREVARVMQQPADSFLNTVTAKYANADTAVTIALWCGQGSWKGMRKALEDRGLWKHYLFRMDSIRMAYEMECRGTTHSKKRNSIIKPKFEAESKQLESECVSLAELANYEVKMPKGRMNNSIKHLFYNVFKVPIVYNKKGRPTLDKKNAMPHYLNILKPDSVPHKFVKAYVAKGKFDTSLAFLRDYDRFSLRTNDPDTLLLHPNYNPTGSKTLRWTHNNPNSANISNQADEEGYSARYIFGPMEGREWWSCDAKNVERRIPDFESGEQALIDLYLKEKEPPFYGSFHIFIFSILWPKLWNDAIKEVGLEHAGEYCKKKYKNREYGWTKNFNFSVQYGSGKKNADLTAHLDGAFDLVAHRLTKLNTLNQKQIAHANKYGYVETLPDRTVDSTKGYPLLCTMMDTGKVLTTIPLSYHVQGTAMWITSSAMSKVDCILREWRGDGFDAFMTLQIHDEVVFDLPKRADPRTNPRQSNLARMRIIQKTMASCGYDLIPEIPVPFGLEYHPDNFSPDSGIVF